MSIVGISLFFTASAQAWQIKNHSSSYNQPENTQLLAKLRNYCDNGESVFFSGETKGFWVNICGGDLPHHYVGVDKRNTNNRIRLSLADYSEDGSYFQAKNKGVIYEILMNTTKGSFLLVTQGNKQLVRQPLLDWE